jgi:Mor family transcriptional regulator
LQKYVVYVAAKPPRSVFRNIAARMGRTIIYIPIGQLSPVALKKIRVVHVLDGHDKREIAKQYLW